MWARKFGQFELSEPFWGFIWRTTGFHQIALAVLSIVVFLLTTAPLELQRRIVNDAFKGGSFPVILWLIGAYALVSLVSGLMKLWMNVYRSWVGEHIVRSLREEVDGRIAGRASEAEGVRISLIVAEADPVGGFVGTAVSEPVLQAGTLISVLGYMVFLQPTMALVALCILGPQLLIVPPMQKAINWRVSKRIAVLREVGVAIVDDPETAGGAAQKARFDTAFELNMGIYKLKFSMNFIMNFMRQLGVCAILGLGGWYVVQGETKVGTVVAFISGLSTMNDPWNDLVNWVRDMWVADAKYKLIKDAVDRLGDPAAVTRDAEEALIGGEGEKAARSAG